jgi:hypothetical protein
MANRENTSTSQWLIGLILFVAIGFAALSILLSDNTGRKGNQLSSEFQYNIDRLRVTDPSLIIGEEITTAIKINLATPHSIALSSADDLYITNGTEVHSFTKTGNKRSFRIDTDNEITAIHVAQDGMIFLGIQDRIETYDAAGQLLSKWESLDAKAIVSAIGTVDEAVFIADRGNRTVHHYDRSGKAIAPFGYFVIPSPFFDLVVSSENVHVVNPGEHRIETYSFKGDLVSWWGEFSCLDPKGFCGCCNPVNIALLPGQEGFVATEKGLTRVKMYGQEGSFTGFVAGTEQFKEHDQAIASPSYPLKRTALDVAIGSDGRIYVLDPALAEVRIFQKKTNNDEEM